MNCKIDIRGLATGDHRYQFHLDGTFFEMYENDTISDAKIDATLLLTKEAGAIKGAVLEISGDVVVACDRCLADLTLPIQKRVSLAVVKEGSQDESEAEDIVYIDRNGIELDLSQVIYDYVCLSLPMKMTHPEGECEAEMESKMKEIIIKID